jgi:gluconolactonase
VAPLLEAARFRPFATGLNAPEGVVWDPEREVLYAGGRHGELYRVSLDGTVDQVAHFGRGSFVLGLALDSRGRIYACERGNGRFLRVDPDTFAFEPYTGGTRERRLITPNYPVFDSDGVLYLSDSGSWEQDDGVLFRVLPDGDTTVWLTTLCHFPNGLALAPDGTALYVAESGTSSIWRVPIGMDGSAQTPELVWSKPRTFTDGIAFDAAGRLYASMYRPDVIYRIDVSTGEAEIVADDWTAQYLQAPTNIAFAGEGLSCLVTANLAGEHLNLFDGPLPAPGQPLHRPPIAP